jgi:hypothetical protein
MSEEGQLYIIDAPSVFGIGGRVQFIAPALLGVIQFKLYTQMGLTDVLKHKATVKTLDVGGPFEPVFGIVREVHRGKIGSASEPDRPLCSGINVDRYRYPEEKRVGEQPFHVTTKILIIVCSTYNWRSEARRHKSI